MDKAKLQERLDKLNQEFLRLQSDLQAYYGAIQEVKFWLNEIEEEEDK